MIAVPRGFSFSGVAAGIKPVRRDVGILVSDRPALAVGRFTVNRARAACLSDAAARLPRDDFRALVVNSGNANALTGPEGIRAVADVHRAVETTFELPRDSVYTSSTGVIGVKFPVGKVLTALPKLVDELEGAPHALAEAMLTTDTRTKMASRVVRCGGISGTVFVVAKGSGMVAPELATTIVVLATDLAVTRAALDEAIDGALADSLSMLVVDGEMSTNDALWAIANGAAGNAPIAEKSAECTVFAAAVRELLIEMAKDVAADGEGATKRLETHVTGAPTPGLARDLARAVTASPLVKASLFGADPNWGRILAAIGARVGTAAQNDPAAAAIDPSQASVTLAGVLVYDGAPVDFDRRTLRAKLREPEVVVDVDVRAGAFEATAWGCDLSYDYVKINADYTSAIVTDEEGAVRRDDRLSNYSPKFKVSLLVQALRYISNFRGQRCVVKFGGASLARQVNVESFCEDILLLRSVGLCPIVVHGAGKEIGKAFDRIGDQGKYVDDIRVNDEADLTLVEMVLSGKINGDLVTSLNRAGGNAVGVSGKDAGLLRAKKAVREDGQDLGRFGELTAVNKGYLELLLAQGYVPVVSPMALGEDGESYSLSGDDVAAGIAAALGAQKLILLADAPGIVENGELVSELSPQELQLKMDRGVISGGMAAKGRAALKALAAGVPSIHVLDGRTPHGVIAELFTDNGVGTWIQENGRDRRPEGQS